MSSIKNKILVIAPHHDDEVFGCGGFIKKNSEEGNLVSVLFITSGWSGVKDRQLSKDEKVHLRELEAKSAGAILGVKNFVFLRKEDRTIYADELLLSQLVRTIQEEQPNIVIASHQDESDFEHKIINNLAKEAVWLAKEGNFISDLAPAEYLEKFLFYEVWTPIINPTLHIDITHQMEAKIRAITEYKSQLVTRNYADLVTGLNMFRGARKGCKYAEAFQEKIL